MTRVLTLEIAAHGIQVNAILPGWFETDPLRGMPNTDSSELIRRKTPAGRWGNPDDLVGAAVFLASRASDFVTALRYRWTVATPAQTGCSPSSEARERPLRRGAYLCPVSGGGRESNPPGEPRTGLGGEIGSGWA